MSKQTLAIPTPAHSKNPDSAAVFGSTVKMGIVTTQNKINAAKQNISDCLPR
jgi:hypothetical protein